MQFLIMANGEYGDLDWYRDRALGFDRVFCADGGAGVARSLGIVPDMVVGDLDSLSPADRDCMAGAGVPFSIHPAEKNRTDTQLALELATAEGAAGITIWGGTGSRLDHTLSNLFSAAGVVVRGIDVRFETPDMNIYFVRDRLVVPGRVGDTVSLIVPGDRATGVTLHGFKYPLDGATLEGYWQFAVSNIIVAERPAIELASGILVVIHYLCLPR
jgi:thiamine pyrophosphokinase